MSAPLEVEMRLLPHQWDLVEEKAAFIKAIVGGFGSGKTHGAVAAGIDLGFENAPLPGMWVEPTYSLVERVAIPAWIDACEAAGLEYRTKADKMIEIGNRGGQWFPVWFFTGDRPERIVGVNAAWAVIDEPGIQKKEVFNKVLARCRHPDSRRRQIVLAGTPEGFNWFFDVSMSGADNVWVRQVPTDENWHLPPEYADQMTAHLSAEEAQQYRRGEFVALGGRVYHAFSRGVHLRECENPAEGHLELWCDFNVSKMAWCVARVIGDEFHVFHEHIGYNTDTEEHAARFMEWLNAFRMEHGTMGQGMPVAIVDASAKARKTSAAMSDVQHLIRRGFHVKHPAHNPPIRDRVAAVNHALRHRRLFIDPKGAPYFAQCIEQQGRDGAGMPEKHSDPRQDLSHGADAIGYGVHFSAPVWGQTFREYAGG